MTSILRPSERGSDEPSRPSSLLRRMAEDTDGLPFAVSIATACSCSSVKKGRCAGATQHCAVVVWQQAVAPRLERVDDEGPAAAAAAPSLLESVPCFTLLLGR